MISNSYSETPSELRSEKSSENSSENHNECSELYSETPLEHYIVSSESSLYSVVSSLYSEACEARRGRMNYTVQATVFTVKTMLVEAF